MKMIFMILSAIALTTALSFQPLRAQEAVEKWPGVTVKVLLENEQVKVAEVTFAPGSVADWHSHPDHSIYAITDIKLKEEIKDKETEDIEMKAGQAGFSKAVTHKVTNTSKKAGTAIVTELKHTH